MDLLPEQCGNDRMNMRRIVVERQAIKIKKLEKENEWLINQLAYIHRKDGELIVEEMQQALKEK